MPNIWPTLRDLQRWPKSAFWSAFFFGSSLMNGEWRPTNPALVIDLPKTKFVWIGYEPIYPRINAPSLLLISMDDSFFQKKNFKKTVINKCLTCWWIAKHYPYLWLFVRMLLPPTLFGPPPPPPRPVHSVIRSQRGACSQHVQSPNGAASMDRCVHLKDPYLT